MNRAIKTVPALLAGVFALADPVRAAGPEYADSVYFNGRVYTVDRRRSWADAVAIRNGRFVYVGPDEGARAYVGDATKVTDLRGRLVMPGIGDLHIHAVSGAIHELYECQLSPSDSVAAISAKVQACAARAAPDEWVRGGSWAIGLLQEGSGLHRSVLDAAAPTRPVWLTDSSGHNAWVNSRALDIIGITRATPDPPAGRIVREAGTGEPTGLLLERAAQAARGELPPWRAEQYQAAVRWSLQRLNEYGIVAFKDAATEDAAFDAYAATDAAGNLTARVATCMPWSGADSGEANLVRLRKRLQRRTGRIDPNCVKFFLDGVPPARTAVFLEPYLPDAQHDGDYAGEFLYDPQRLRRDVVLLDRNGVTVKMHAGGDAAARAALDAIEAARKANGASGPRHEVAHVNFVSAADVRRFGELHGVADMSPAFWFPSPFIRALSDVLGAERANHIFPFRSLVDSGAEVIYGSDWPSVVPNADPWPGIEAMVTRRDPHGRFPGQLWSSEAIELATAIEIVTRNAARAMGLESATGSIEVGKSADMIVLDGNLFEIDPDRIGETQVDETVLEGRVVFSRHRSRASGPE